MQADSNNQALEKGYKLHWFEIRSVIGRGGFGITYLAHDNHPDTGGQYRPISIHCYPAPAQEIVTIGG